MTIPSTPDDRLRAGIALMPSWKAVSALNGNEFTINRVELETIIAALTSAETLSTDKPVMGDGWRADSTAVEAAAKALRIGRGCESGEVPCPFCHWPVPDSPDGDYSEVGCIYLAEKALAAAALASPVMAVDRRAVLEEAAIYFRRKQGDFTGLEIAEALRNLAATPATVDRSEVLE